jgi:hypothetical protein
MIEKTVLMKQAYVVVIILKRCNKSSCLFVYVSFRWAGRAIGRAGARAKGELNRARRFHEKFFFFLIQYFFLNSLK